jgi:short-subunit dehydrogenase
MHRQLNFPLAILIIMKNIIIGGTHGLGKEIASLLQTNGDETYIVGRTYNEADHGEGARIDLASSADARILAKRISNLGDAALSFYWVSGYGYNGDYIDQERPEMMAAVNFGNVLPAAQEAYRKMLRDDVSSHFVVISSTSGYKARKDEAVYAGTKHAQVGFTRSLGLETERLGASVKVALFMPGGMQTPFWDGNRPQVFNDFLDPAKVAEHIVAHVVEQTEPFYEEVIERGSL